jgi:hypothetical protein
MKYERERTKYVNGNLRSSPDKCHGYQGHDTVEGHLAQCKLYLTISNSQNVQEAHDRDPLHRHMFGGHLSHNSSHVQGLGRG